jgi:hypothetical protein
MKTWGSGGIAPSFVALALGGCEWSDSHLYCFTLRETAPDTLYRRLGGPQSWSEHCGEEWNILPLPGIKPQLLSHPACSLVTILTELSQLLKLVHISTKFWNVYMQLEGMWCVWFVVGHESVKRNLMQYCFSLSSLWSMVVTFVNKKNSAYLSQNVFTNCVWFSKICSNYILTALTNHTL